jgi:hypothetical protein
MSPLASWALVLSLIGLGWLLVFALMRAASRTSRMEERCHELDSTVLALAAYRGKFKGGKDEAEEGPPPRDAA